MATLLDTAQVIVDTILGYKCSNDGCWHYQTDGKIYCNHCYYGSCSTITEERQEQLVEAQKVLQALS